MSVTITAFYKFVAIEDPEALREAVFAHCGHGAIMGTILIAPEGINATIAGSDAAIRSVLAWLRADPRFANLVSKESYADKAPFGHLRVKIKREIVTMRRPEADPGKQVGTYVPPEQWNELVSRDDVIVVDTRNAYEVEIGTFKGAVDPGTSAFSEFPDFVQANLDPATHKRVAMFCTGGIRCEKASAYLLSQGFPEVYHLEGGILKYLETIPPEQSLWQGECFVFDERVSLEHGVRPGSYVMCYACGMPYSRETSSENKSSEAGTCATCSSGGKLQSRDRRDEQREKDDPRHGDRLVEK